MEVKRCGRFIILIVVCVNSMLTFAQQEAMFTHYMYNTLAINPAYAGSRDALTITALHRSQWVSFPGAPKTQTLTMHSPVCKDVVNLGLSFINDKIGPVNNTGLFLDYAFRTSLSEKSKLALGLKMGVNAYSFDLAKLSTINPIDNKATQSERSFSPNVGLGVYYSMERFYVGLSTPKLFKNNYHYSGSAMETDLSIEQQHFYFIIGGLVPLSNYIKLKPTAFVKVTQAAPIEGDFTTEFLFDDKYSLGLMYRTGDALGVLLGLAINEHLSVGYSFDWSFVNETATYNYGSHEIMLQYDFTPKRKKRYTSIKSFCKF